MDIRNKGLGPRAMRIGTMVRITREAAAEWRHKWDNASAKVSA